MENYDTTTDLEADLGPPVDLNSLGNADTPDPNVLDIMERYDMSAEELALFLDSYENVEDIYFLGDLENALNIEGFVPVDGIEDSEEPATEETDQGTEEPATAETGQEPEYAFGMPQIEEVYLTPLGWTEEEFSTYVEDNYNLSLIDVGSFEELEATVGPVLTEDRLEEILDSYGLTPEEYRELLTEYGETPEDYNFVYQLEEALDYYSSGEAANAETVTGGEMPQTATDSLLMTLIGFGAAAVGALMLFRSRPQGEK